MSEPMTDERLAQIDRAWRCGGGELGELFQELLAEVRRLREKDNKPPLLGVCCACGYCESEETECPMRDDTAHCEHWYDGRPARGVEMAFALWFEALNAAGLDCDPGAGESDEHTVSITVDHIAEQITELRAALETVCNAFESIVPSSQSGTLLKRDVLQRVAHLRRKGGEDEAIPRSPGLAAE